MERNGVECYLRGCADLADPLEEPAELAALTDARREKIRKYKASADRKRSFCAGLMIAEHLGAHGRKAEEITIDSHGRPRIDGLDFNLSHAGDYVLMAISDSAVGCDIERIRDRKSSIARRFFSEREAAWIDGSEEPLSAFYRIWTARESYVKYTGEGISLNFQRYEIIMDDTEKEAPVIEGDLKDAEFLGSAVVLRDSLRQGCAVFQWRCEKSYILSICCEWTKGVRFA